MKPFLKKIIASKAMLVLTLSVKGRNNLQLATNEDMV